MTNPLQFDLARFRRNFEEADRIRETLDNLQLERLRLEARMVESLIRAMLDHGCVMTPPEGNFRRRS